MSKKVIFISGVAGFLGSHLADRLVKQGHRVIGCDSLVHGGELENVSPSIEFHVQDVRDFPKMKKLLSKVDVVFHAAALGHDGFSVHSPYIISENLYSSTASLISASAQAGVQRFVYCSSMARYGNQASTFTEDMDCKPVTPYGVSKVACEELVKNIADTHSMEWSICVPHNIIGPRQKYDDPYRNVAAIMINRLLQNLPPIIYGSGEQRRCFSSIWDVVSVLESLLFSPSANRQVVNIGPDDEVISINELALYLNQILDKDLRPLYFPARAQEVLFASCSADKARRLFGYVTEHNLHSTLLEFANWISAKGPKPFKYSMPLEIIGAKTPVTWQDHVF